MSKRIAQYKSGKENLYFFYRFIVLRWELEWTDQKFLLSVGELQEFCYVHKISLKSFDSTAKLNKALKEEFKSASDKYEGVIWFNKKDTKPKDVLRHLRNTFAHGNFSKRQKNRINCIVFENIDKKQIKAKGFIPIELIKPLIAALETCRADD